MILNVGGLGLVCFLLFLVRLCSTSLSPLSPLPGEKAKVSPLQA